MKAEIKRANEEIENMKYKRELLNMKLILAIFNKEDNKTIKQEIKRLTKIIGDKYLDAEEQLNNNIKQIVKRIINKKITEDNSYEYAMELEEYIINQGNELTIQEKNKIIKKYQKLNYYPISTDKEFSTVKQDSIDQNKKDYISEVLFYIINHDNYIDDNKLSIIKLLRDEIAIKTKEKAIKKIKRI